MIVVDRALTLRQPWASLVGIGWKLYETRSWRTAYRGWLAIHAANGFPKECRALCYRQPFALALANAGFHNPDGLPRGQVIAVVKLTDCISTDTWQPPKGSNERDFGDYSPDRWAWKLENVQRIATPFAAKGALGIWRLPIQITADEVPPLK
jgi:hypothetical protein